MLPVTVPLMSTRMLPAVTLPEKLRPFMVPAKRPPEKQGDPEKWRSPSRAAPLWRIVSSNEPLTVVWLVQRPVHFPERSPAGSDDDDDDPSRSPLVVPEPPLQPTDAPERREKKRREAINEKLDVMPVLVGPLLGIYWAGDLKSPLRLREARRHATLA